MRARFVNEAFEEKNKVEKRDQLLYPYLLEITWTGHLWKALENNLFVPEWKIKEIVNQIKINDTYNLSKADEYDLLSEETINTIIDNIKTPFELINTTEKFKSEIPEKKIKEVINKTKNIYEITSLIETGFNVPDTKIQEIIKNIKDIGELCRAKKANLRIPKEKIEEIINALSNMYELKAAIDDGFTVPEKIYNKISREITELEDISLATGMGIKVPEKNIEKAISTAKTQTDISYVNKMGREVSPEKVEKIVKPSGKSKITYLMLKALEDAGEEGMQRKDILKAACKPPGVLCSMFNTADFTRYHFQLGVKQIGYGRYAITDFGKKYIKKYEEKNK